MKKLLAILLALAMVMSLAACGSAPADDDDKKDKDDKEIVETTEETTEEETTEEAPEEVIEEGVIVKGTIDGDVYKNPSMGITFTKPESWVYSTDEEIADMNGADYEEYSDPEDFQDFLDSAGSFYDMAVEQPDSGSNVMVLVEDLSVYDSVGISAEDYQDMLAETFLATGMYELDGEYTDVTLGDAEYSRAVYSCEVSGVTISQAYYIAMNGDYVICIIVTPGAGDDIASIEAMFS